jgi:hypothetical protein
MKPKGQRRTNSAYALRKYQSSAVTGAVAALAATLVVGCDTAQLTSAAETAFASVDFTVRADGGIGISGPAVTAAGSYAVTWWREHRFARPAGKTLVVLRHWAPRASTDRAARAGERLPARPAPEEQPVESAYLVDTAGRLRAELDGHPLEWVHHGTVRIDATYGKAGHITRVGLSAGGKPPPDGGSSCAAPDPYGAARKVVLPHVTAGARVTEVVSALRAKCLDVQYASRSADAAPGTVAGVVVPTTAGPGDVVILPSDGTPARRTVWVHPLSPATVIVAG